MKTTILSLFLLINYFSQAQEEIDTVFFNESWQKLTDRKDARFFRLAKKEKELYKFQDYYINGVLQSEGFFTTLDSEYKVGYFKSYRENGVLASEGEYSENKRNGKWKSYYENGELYTEEGFLLEKNIGELIVYFKSGKIKRKEEYLNDSMIKGKCYNEKGDEIKFFPFEIMPEYPGGDDGLMQFLVNNINYPKKAQMNDITGNVLVNFIVGVNGKVSNVKVIKSVHPLLDAEAIRVVKNMPRWTPGMQDGEPVRVFYHVPINFTLE